jgi:ComF family protein
MRSAGAGTGRLLLDFALPPRCPACGDIVADVDVFCGDCWGGLHFLGQGCERCGVPLTPAEEGECGACTQAPGALARSRAALAYGDAPRTIAMRLKYGRKIALARTMASTMKRPLADLSPDALLVPVPFHRWRLWRRGFNQAVLIARALGREVDPDLLRRTRATPRHKGLNPAERRATVRGAFEVRPGADIKGCDIILVDDVITTGATAEACARVLRKAGAARVELLAFARVLA